MSAATCRRTEYEAFLRAKMVAAPQAGLAIAATDTHPWLKPHARDIVAWCLQGSRRAIFARFGLAKTSMQLEIARLLLREIGGKSLITMPLGVRQEFFRDARSLGMSDCRFIRHDHEASAAGVYFTNYESIRDGKLDPRNFNAAVCLDEASVLRSFGSKTFSEFVFGKFRGMQYKFVATATPSPNDYIELLAYAAFLEVMDIGEAKTRFFKRDSTKADHLTLHPHKKREFYLWCSTWGIFIEKPSDLGYSDEGYDLPPIEVHWHEIASDHADAGMEKNGQARLTKRPAIGVVDASREKRASIPARLAKLMELRALDPGAHRILWHDLEAERFAIQKAIPAAAAVWGTQDIEERERRIIRFSDGQIQELATKAEIAGSGCNFQRHCAWAIFLGIGFKFNDFIQAIHRIHRFGQTRPVRIDLIYTEAERAVREELERKWRQDIDLRREMANIIREYGLARASIEKALERSFGVERREVSGRGWSVAHNDCVLEAMDLPDASAHLVLTSIPFSTQYEYSASYNDFGHTDDAEHFWRQMDFLTPELLRILSPGRLCAIHVKDRVQPGEMSGLGFQTIDPFHADAIAHFRRHGFSFLGMKTIVTDVVRENNQTYRLGWTEQCKDGSRMGFGLPEYLLLFRKPPTDNNNGYADVPVVKSKSGYTRGRWQFDAHGFARSSGNRLLSPDELAHLTYAGTFRRFREHSLSNVYDFERDVAIAEAADRAGMLPPDFMLLQPQSWHPDVWTDVTRMRTLNSKQTARQRETHLCPLQFDIVQRAIQQYTMPGEVVFDPFCGIGTVVQQAVLLDRVGRGCELNGAYFDDAVYYCQAAEGKRSIPSLFDALEIEGAVAEAEEERVEAAD